MGLQQITINIFTQGPPVVTCPGPHVKTNYHLATHKLEPEVEIRKTLTKLRSTGNLQSCMTPIAKSNKSTFSNLGFKPTKKGVTVKGKGYSRLSFSFRIKPNPITLPHLTM